jgi:UDP-glucuronate 4-epimerase
MSQIKILITGTAGFIGFHLASRLIDQGYDIHGLDNINDYYDLNLKYARLEQHGIYESFRLKNREILKSKKFNNYTFIKADIADHDYIVGLMIQERYTYVINLAAQAGVRYSIENPRVYTSSNINGFLSILEGCRYSEVKHLLYASTSSVYGLNSKTPFNEDMSTEHPMAYYAATKKANELMAHSYSHLFLLPTTGLRFFTVYGPWGRPDMALFLFIKSIIDGGGIKIFNNGAMSRDFTYVDDIIESITRLILLPAGSNLNWDSENPEISSSSAPYKIYNIGNSAPQNLMEYISTLENVLGKSAIKEFLPMQPGDLLSTYANTNKLEKLINFTPNTNIKDGISAFVKWYKTFYNVV